MSKGDRKRAVKAPEKKLSPREKATTSISRKDAMPLQQNEAFIFKELIDQSNHYGKLMQQYEQYEFALQNMIYKRKQIQKGEIEISKQSPIYVPLVGNSLCPLTNKKMVLKDIDTQIKQITLSRDGIRGQMIQRRDEYIESALRLRTFIENRFGQYTSTSITVPKQVTGVRTSAGKDQQKATDQKIFEAEFDDIMKSAEKQDEVKAKIAEAIKHNKELEAKQKA